MIFIDVKFYSCKSLLLSTSRSGPLCISSQCNDRCTSTSIRLKRPHIFKSLLACPIEFDALPLKYLVRKSFQTADLSLRLISRFGFLFLMVYCDAY